MFISQLVASGDCAGALDVTDDLQHLLVCFHRVIKSYFKFFVHCSKVISSLSLKDLAHSHHLKHPCSCVIFIQIFECDMVSSL